MVADIELEVEKKIAEQRLLEIIKLEAELNVYKNSTSFVEEKIKNCVKSLDGITTKSFDNFSLLDFVELKETKGKLKALVFGGRQGLETCLKISRGEL